MDDLCDQMNNSQVWDPAENYDLFIYDYHDYERFILSGMDFDDTHEKVMRATSYVRFIFSCVHALNLPVICAFFAETTRKSSSTNERNSGESLGISLRQVAICCIHALS